MIGEKIMKKQDQPPKNVETFEDMGLTLGLKRGSREPNRIYEPELQRLARLRKEKQEQ